METIDDTLLQRIWQARGLGAVEAITRPARGSINPCFIVNDSDVVRFTTLTDKGGQRFESERMAYDILRDSGIPVPQVVVLDTSLEIAPYAYLITTKLPGAPVVDSWPDLTLDQQQRVAYEAGQYLAQIHTYTFDRFGKLRSLDFADWYGYVADFLSRYVQQALQVGGISTREQAQMESVLRLHRSVLDRITRGSLVHSDYHFENILQQNGVVTGIVDFEWAYSGDPLSDLVADEQWERMCPGSRAHVRAGYTALRSPGSDSDIRLVIYRMLFLLETLVDHKKAGHESAYRETHDRLMALVDALPA